MACRSGAPAPVPERCGPAVPAEAQHPLTARAGTLAGEYQLIQVRTQPDAGAVATGRLHLAPPDSLARAGAVGGTARDLVGWLDATQGDSAWRPGAGSRDPEHPGAVLSGDHLRLGQPAVDSPVEQLEITAVSEDGFWGWWKAEPGWELAIERGTSRVVPDPAGYFCALRARS